MRKIALFLTIIAVVSCKNLYNLPEGNIEIAKINNERYKLNYPKNWHTSNVKGYSNNNSIAIFRFKQSSFKSASFSLILDVYKTELGLKGLQEDLKNKDFLLKNANIKSYKQNANYVEIMYTQKIKSINYKGIKRFYLKESKVSEIDFRAKEEDFEDFRRYKNLFFGTFKLK